MAGVTGLMGFVSTGMIGGLGICGFDLTPRMICFALVSAVVLPAATVRLLPTPWWVAALLFCNTIPMGIVFEVLGREWNRVGWGLACVAAAVASAWLFRSREGIVSKQK